VSISSDDDANFTEESDGKYDSEHFLDVDIHLEDDVDAPSGVDLDGDVDMDRDGHKEEAEDEEEEDEEKEDEDEEQDDDEYDGKEPWTIGQGETLNTSAGYVDTMVDNQPIVLPQQGQEMREHTPQPKPPAPAPRTQTPEPSSRPRPPETDPLCGLEFSWIVTPQNHRPAVPTLREAGAAGNTSDEDVDQQLLAGLAGGHSLADVPLHHVPLPDVPLPNVPLHDIPLPGAHLDGLVSEKWTTARDAEEAMVIAHEFGLGSCVVHFVCSYRFISGIDHYTHREVFESLRVDFLYGFCIGCILFIVLWDIAHAVFLQLLACKEPPCDGVEAQ